jgi:hypothetical protein
VWASVIVVPRACNVPDRHGPEELSDIARRLTAIADGIVPAPVKPKGQRQTTGITVINGRRITVQHRLPFKIFV